MYLSPLRIGPSPSRTFEGIGLAYSGTKLFAPKWRLSINHRPSREPNRVSIVGVPDDMFDTDGSKLLQS